MSTKTICPVCGREADTISTGLMKRHVPLTGYDKIAWCSGGGRTHKQAQFIQDQVLLINERIAYLERQAMKHRAFKEQADLDRLNHIIEGLDDAVETLMGKDPDNPASSPAGSHTEGR